MALSSLRLRRAAALSSALFRSHPAPTTLPKPACPLPTIPSPSRHSQFLPPRSLSFHSSATSFFRGDSSSSGDGKISPDEILFEGCDYNHWLVTVDFPKDPKPTPEQMVETYVETATKVFGSREEAMQKIYACSTTTYNGFQVLCSEEVSEKFRGLPGVVFILPDSYIDPVNKEYGGDKYEMGKITHRPPPIQYGRQGRYGDRNRNFDRPRYDRPRDSMPTQQGNPSYDRQGSYQNDGRNYAPQPTYSPAGQQGPPSSQNYASQQNYNTAGQQGYPSSQNQYPAGQQGPPSYNNQGSMQGDARNYSPQQRYSPAGGRDYPQAGRDNYQAPPYQRDFNQGQQGNFGTQEQGGFTPGQSGSYRDTGSFGGTGYRQGPPPGYGQGSSSPPPGQNFQTTENRGGIQEQPNSDSPGFIGNRQGQY